MSLLVLLAVIGLTGAYPLEDPDACQPNSRPWQVYLHGDGVSSSGVLVNQWWIVTSFEYAMNAHNAIATLGDHDLTMDEGTEQHIRVAAIIPHSPYRSPLHSLALVRLAEPARFNQFVQPIALPRRCPLVGEACVVSGWGSTDPSQDQWNGLMKCVPMSVVDRDTCEETFPDFIYWSPGMVCAGQLNSTACLTGQGSVLVCDGQLQGVQWFSLGCEQPGNPNVFTKLCQYRNWIESVMGSPKTTTSPTSTMLHQTKTV